LYSQGQLRLGDPDRILLIVSRTDDKTPLLTFDEDRLLSAIPADSAKAFARSDHLSGLGETRSSPSFQVVAWQAHRPRYQQTVMESSSIDLRLSIEAFLCPMYLGIGASGAM
jgi:hypothetical protein